MDLHLANQLNKFYCCSERRWTVPTPPPTTLSILERDVNRLFESQNSDSQSTLKHCADQLSPVFTGILYTSLETSHVPVPKTTRITGLNDHRPVTLTSVVMKSFGHLVLSDLKTLTDRLLDLLPFVSRANRSVGDVVNMALNLILILQHLDSSATYARILFVDFSSAFNTIIPSLLQDELSQLTLPASGSDFLSDRKQHVKLGKHVSASRTISTGSPQGCALSPLLFSL